MNSVTLRGLTIDGGRTVSNGIVFNSGGKLTIDQCNVLNFRWRWYHWKRHHHTTNIGDFFRIVITNTTASNNGDTGVAYLPASGSATTTMVIDHVTSNNNNINGIRLKNDNSTGSASAIISNSIASGNPGTGFAFSHLGASLDLSYASGNLSAGIVASNSAVLSLGRSVIVNNNDGISITSGGMVNSYQDNRIVGNGTPVSGTLGTAALF